MRRLSFAPMMLALVWASLAPAQTVEEIVKKNHDARGGIDKIRAVESARIQGKMVMGGQMEAPFLFEWKIPDKTRIEFTVQGQTGITAFTGDAGWSFMPFMGHTEAVDMSEAELADAADESDFHGPLVDYKEKGHNLALVGTEEIDGKKIFKLELTRASGNIVHIFVDSESYLEVRNEATKLIEEGMEVLIEISIEDYKAVDGVLMAHRLDQKIKGAPVGQAMIFETIELNVDVPDSRFDKPAPAAAAPPEKDAAPEN